VRKRTNKNASTSQTPAPAENGSTSAGEQSTQPAQQDETELGEEGPIRAKERNEIEALVEESVKSDVGASWTGLYELVGQSFLYFLLVFLLILIICLPL
jgi:ubiquitin carboxyl-terminal hydrolase 14